MPIIKSGSATLAGCSRNFVLVSNRKYEVSDKTPEYCSIFGLPDDCYDPGFETRMIDSLKSCHRPNIWCFEKTPYISSQVEPYVKLLYMKGEFLPSSNFIYVDTPERFLTAVFTSKELQSITSELWYSTGRELIEEMNLGNGQCFRFEEKANYYIQKRLIYEFARQSLLLTKRDEFSSFQTARPLAFEPNRKADIETCLQNIVHKTEKDNELHIANLMRKIDSYVDMQSLKRSHFMIMDVEHIHIPYPTSNREGFFNFPCIFSNLIWHGAKGLETNTNVFIIPCHYCGQPCRAFKKNTFDFGCMLYGFDFIERQNFLIEEMLSRYEGFKIYTYGRSDAFQLEQGSSFFSDSFEWRKYERRNRKIAKRITEICVDLSEPSIALDEIESGILYPWLNASPRKQEKVNVNSRFMTQFDNPSWETSYSEAIASCLADTTSAFFYLLYKKYRINEGRIQGTPLKLGF